MTPLSMDTLNSTHDTSKLLPSNYTLLTVVGRGGFGEVLKCFKEDTKETVAVKIPLPGSSIQNELKMLKHLKSKNLDNSNIARFLYSFKLRNKRIALAFEMLGVDLYDYFAHHRNFTPLMLYDIRSVVQQMATALDALKTIKVIHADIKLSNIVLVDPEVQPLRVKLIDFGVAFPTSRAWRSSCHQNVNRRAPEIILGLAFSEAIDMWSLGTVIACILVGRDPFPGRIEYDVMRQIVELLGVPPDHLLKAGWFSSDYFIKRCSGDFPRWRLKTIDEYYVNLTRPGNYDSFPNLENLDLLSLNMVQAAEKEECIDLLKAMLQIDAKKRIIPSQVLTHPFITRGTLHHSSDTNESLGVPTASQLGVTLVKPSQPACGLAGERAMEPKDKTSNTCEAFAAPSASTPGVTLSQPPQTASSLSSVTSGVLESAFETSPPGASFVKFAPAECCLWLDEDSGQSEAWLEDISEEKPEKLPPFLSEECDVEQEHTELTALIFDDMEPKKRTKRKQKNCFKRFFAWAKRTFCSCVSVDNEED